MKSRISNPEIDKLILLISKLPGFGPKSASRAALHLIKNKEQLMVPLAESLLSSSENIVTCEICGNIDVNSPCMISQMRVDLKIKSVLLKISQIYGHLRNLKYLTDCTMCWVVTYLL